MNKTYLNIILIGILLLLLGGASWYFLRPYDYAITFTSKTLPGTINQTLKSWSTSLQNSEITKNNSITSLEQRLTYGDEAEIYKWKLTSKNDADTKVRVEIKLDQNNLKNRFLNLFTDTDAYQRSQQNIRNFLILLEDHLKAYRIELDGISISPTTYIAYVSLKSKQFQKAKEMMQTYPILSDVMLKNKIELNGRPIIDITDWNTKNDSIHFDFCFPIQQRDSLFEHPTIKYRKLAGKKSLKATYYGNYMSSDRAWYALIDYAEKNNIEIEKNPIEVLHNNPMQGGDDRLWKTEVYMPIAE